VSQESEDETNEHSTWDTVEGGCCLLQIFGAIAVGCLALVAFTPPLIG